MQLNELIKIEQQATNAKQKIEKSQRILSNDIQTVQNNSHNYCNY